MGPRGEIAPSRPSKIPRKPMEGDSPKVDELLPVSLMLSVSRDKASEMYFLAESYACSCNSFFRVSERRTVSLPSEGSLHNQIALICKSMNKKP